MVVGPLPGSGQRSAYRFGLIARCAILLALSRNYCVCVRAQCLLCSRRVCECVKEHRHRCCRRHTTHTHTHTHTGDARIDSGPSSSFSASNQSAPKKSNLKVNPSTVRNKPVRQHLQRNRCVCVCAAVPYLSGITNLLLSRQRRS